MPAAELAEVARGIFGQDRVSEASSLADAIDQAAALAEAGESSARRSGPVGPGHRLGGHRGRGARDASSPREQPDAAPALRRDPAARGDRVRAQHAGPDLPGGHRDGGLAGHRPRADLACLLVAGRSGSRGPTGSVGRSRSPRSRSASSSRRCSSWGRSSWRCGPRRTSWAARSRSSEPSGRPYPRPLRRIGCAACQAAHPGHLQARRRAAGLIGNILSRFESKGLTIVALELRQIDEGLARGRALRRARRARLSTRRLQAGVRDQRAAGGRGPRG